LSQKENAVALVFLIWQYKRFVYSQDSNILGINPDNTIKKKDGLEAGLSFFLIDMNR